MFVLAYLGPLDCGVQRAADIVEAVGRTRRFDVLVPVVSLSQALLAALDRCRSQLHGAERSPAILDACLGLLDRRLSRPSLAERDAQLGLAEIVLRGAVPQDRRPRVVSRARSSRSLELLDGLADLR